MARPEFSRTKRKAARKIIDFKGAAMSSGFAIVIGASPLDCCQSAADYYSPDDLNEAGN